MATLFSLDRYVPPWTPDVKIDLEIHLEDDLEQEERGRMGKNGKNGGRTGKEHLPFGFELFRFKIALSFFFFFFFFFFLFFFYSWSSLI